MDVESYISQYHRTWHHRGHCLLVERLIFGSKSVIYSLQRKTHNKVGQKRFSTVHLQQIVLEHLKVRTFKSVPGLQIIFNEDLVYFSSFLHLQYYRILTFQLVCISWQKYFTM